MKRTCQLVLALFTSLATTACDEGNPEGWWDVICMQGSAVTFHATVYLPQVEYPADIEDEILQSNWGTPAWEIRCTGTKTKSLD